MTEDGNEGVFGTPPPTGIVHAARLRGRRSDSSRYRPSGADTARWALADERDPRTSSSRTASASFLDWTGVAQRAHRAPAVLVPHRRRPGDVGVRRRPRAARASGHLRHRRRERADVAVRQPVADHRRARRARRATASPSAHRRTASRRAPTCRCLAAPDRFRAQLRQQVIRGARCRARCMKMSASRPTSSGSTSRTGSEPVRAFGRRAAVGRRVDSSDVICALRLGWRTTTCLLDVWLTNPIAVQLRSRSPHVAVGRRPSGSSGVPGHLEMTFAPSPSASRRSGSAS